MMDYIIPVLTLNLGFLFGLAFRTWVDGRQDREFNELMSMVYEQRSPETERPKLRRVK